MLVFTGLGSPDDIGVGQAVTKPKPIRLTRKAIAICSFAMEVITRTLSIKQGGESDNFITMLG